MVLYSVTYLHSEGAYNIKCICENAEDALMIAGYVLKKYDLNKIIICNNIQYYFKVDETYTGYFDTSAQNFNKYTTSISVDRNLITRVSLREIIIDDILEKY